MKQSKNKVKQPLVSIVMPVYNAGEFLVEAIKSLQDQTYQNWELIVVDDQSTDGSWQILKRLAQNDKRIKIYRNAKNGGVARTANLALSKIKGSFIARMDADDVSLSERLEKQVEFLQSHSDVVAVGGQCELIDKNSEIIGEKLFPTEAQDIREMMFSKIPLQQPSMMVNLRLLPKNFIWYEDKFDVAEEVELLFKFFQYGKVCNLPEPVLQYRLHDENISLQNPKHTFYLTLKSRLRAISKYSYQPTITGLIMTLIQLIAVSLLPGQWIYPLYELIRGSKRIELTKLVKPLFLEVKTKGFS
jgi:glycosyltransferase involved in cell wall biosynthesis